MSSFIDLSKNYSLYAIPVAWVLVLVPTSYAKGLAGKVYDNTASWSFNDRVKATEDLDKPTKAKIMRAQQATANGNETLPLFAGAVIAAAAAGVPARSANTLVAAYLATRAVYNYIFVVLQANRRWAPVRSLSWLAGVACWVTLYVKAGNRFWEASA